MDQDCRCVFCVVFTTVVWCQAQWSPVVWCRAHCSVGCVWMEVCIASEHQRMHGGHCGEALAMNCPNSGRSRLLYVKVFRAVLEQDISLLCSTCSHLGPHHCCPSMCGAVAEFCNAAAAAAADDIPGFDDVVSKCIQAIVLSTTSCAGCAPRTMEASR